MNQIKVLLSALSLYTRLPAWRLSTLQTEHYQRAVVAWPLVGLLTGAVLGGVFLLACLVVSIQTAIILAIGARLVLTVGFHEDGLGDFFDGFGGGHTRERVLEIMKDSHVGSYAVLGYVLYYLAYGSVVTDIALWTRDIWVAPLCLLLADVLGKSLSFIQVVTLPYARATEQSKLGHSYSTQGWQWVWIPLLFTLVLSMYYLLGMPGLYALPLPCLLCLGLLMYIRRRIGGYTGDTCGAVSLLCELSALLSFSIALRP